MKKRMKKISIIVAVYNAERYLEKCLESVVHQTVTDKEIIIVNDGSSDTSIDIIQKFAVQYPDIIVIDKENEGTFWSRIDGMRISTGEYIGFVDSDDFISLDMYEKMIIAAEKTGADIVEADYQFFCDQKRDLKSAKEEWLIQQKGKVFGMTESEAVLCSFLKMRTYPQLWKRIYHRNVIEKTLRDVEHICKKHTEYIGIRNEDEFLFPNLLCHAKMYYGMKEQLYYYRHMSKQSISKETNKDYLTKYNHFMVLLQADSYIHKLLAKCNNDKVLRCLYWNMWTDMNNYIKHYTKMMPWHDRYRQGYEGCKMFSRKERIKLIKEHWKDVIEKKEEFRWSDILATVHIMGC